VVFGASDGKVYAVRASDGEKLWEFEVGGQVSGSPTLAKNRIYVTGKKGELWALATHD
jgi:outer membrane protein assembly factor BamB